MVVAEVVEAAAEVVVERRTKAAMAPRLEAVPIGTGNNTAKDKADTEGMEEKVEMVRLPDMADRAGTVDLGTTLAPNSSLDILARAINLAVRDHPLRLSPVCEQPPFCGEGQIPITCAPDFCAATPDVPRPMGPVRCRQADAAAYPLC